jgi:hypothetical protein
MHASSTWLRHSYRVASTSCFATSSNPWRIQAQRATGTASKQGVLKDARYAGRRRLVKDGAVLSGLGQEARIQQSETLHQSAIITMILGKVVRHQQ